MRAICFLCKNDGTFLNMELDKCLTQVCDEETFPTEKGNREKNSRKVILGRK